MKKLGLVLVLVATMFLVSCNCGGSFKYSIKGDGHTYGTNSYKEADGCIKFKYNDNDVKLCGNYTLVKNKNYVDKKRNQKRN
jgi:hypothetical protein